MRHAIAAALAAAALAASRPAPAQEVTLSSPGGGVTIAGRFLSYDGEFYRIDSVYGVLTVDGNGVVCEGAACPGTGPFVPELTISGAAGSSAALVPALLEAFAEARGHAFLRQEEGPDQFLYVLSEPEGGAEVARFRFRVTSSAEGLADLLAEAADVALAFRPPDAEERARAIEAQLGDLFEPGRSGVVALDAIVPVVAPGNPVGAIRFGDLARVLSGRIANWSALGGPDAPIALHLPAAGSALDAGLAARLRGPGDPAAPATRHDRLAALDAAVAADPHALGVTAFSALGAARALDLAGSCGARIAPGPMTIRTEDYPFTSPHFALTPDLRAPAILRDFLAYTRSPAAQPVVREAGFVDQGIAFRSLAAQGDRLARAILATGADVRAPDLRRMVRALQGAEQMSLSFRFENGSADLDAQSRANVALLAEAIRRGDFAGGRLLLAGFSDGQGSGATNLDLSRRRAEAVRAALLEALREEEPPVPIDADGFGEAMPMACDDDAWGRLVNRRVEVWLRRGA